MDVFSLPYKYIGLQIVGGPWFYVAAKYCVLIYSQLSITLWIVKIGQFVDASATSDMRRQRHKCVRLPFGDAPPFIPFANLERMTKATLYNLSTQDRPTPSGEGGHDTTKQLRKPLMTSWLRHSLCHMMDDLRCNVAKDTKLISHIKTIEIL